jgi:diguanylate cyclase (GGDEF)-like protein
VRLVKGPLDATSRQIVAFLCLPIFLIALGFVVIDLAGSLSQPSPSDAYNVVTDILFAVLSLGVWMLNRGGRVNAAAVLLLSSLSAGLVLFFLLTPPARIEILFAAPVMLAAFVLTPWSAFLWAGISSVSFVALNTVHGGERLLDLQVSLALFGVAVIAWLVASSLKWTVAALHQTAGELEQDIAVRLEVEEAQRQVESSLQVARQQRQTLFQNSALGVFLFDKSHIITECNDRLAAQMREPCRRLVGLDLSRTGDQRLLPAMGRALAGSVATYEGPCRAWGNDEQLWVNFTASPLQGTNKEVIGGIGVVTDLTNQRQAEELVQQLAYRDLTTGLPNRSLFRDRLEQAVAVAGRRHQRLVVGVLDIDRFKNVNDTLGHAQGDRLLTEVGQRITELVRDSDSAARSGGDEFLFLLTEVGSARDAALAADRMLASLRRPWHADDRRFFISASIGVAFYPDDAADAQGLLENAHTAMRRAKQQGGDTRQFYDRGTSTLAAERLSLESELHAAVSTQQFPVLYQPQVDMRDGAITGFEALVRWQHPHRGLTPPAEFIALAEETGLIIPLGRQVMFAACAQARAWQREVGRPQRVAVNVSARQLRDPGFATDVAQAIEMTGIASELLEIEITETATMSNAGHCESVLRRLREMGISVSLDDFGTGYSSLSQLRRLPITRLKIDRSFVSGLPEDESSAAIAIAEIDLASALGLGVVAEGVETVEQQAFLIERGCHEAQGFLFSPPVAAGVCSEMLEGHPADSEVPRCKLWARRPDGIPLGSESLLRHVRGTLGRLLHGCGLEGCSRAESPTQSALPDRC